MSSEFLLAVAPAWFALGACVQGIALLLGERPPGRLLARLAAFAALTTAVAAAVAHGSQWQIDMGTLPGGGPSIAGTSVSLAATASMTLTALMLFLCVSRDMPHRPIVTFVELLGTASAVVAAVAGDLWLILAGISIAGWTTALRSVIGNNDESAVRGAVQAVTVGLVGDVFFAAGLLTLSSVGISLNLRELNQADLFSSLGRLEQAYWGLAAYMLLAGLLIRCALFPMAFWIKGIVHSSRDAAWVCGILLPLGGWVLIRTTALWGATSELHDFLIKVGVLSSLLVAVIAAVQSRADRIICYAAAAQLGLLWASEGVVSRHPSPGIGFFILGTTAFPLAVLFAAGLQESVDQNSPRASRAHWPVLGLAAVWGSGLLGQEWLFNELWNSVTLTAGAAVPARGIPPVVVGAMPAAHLLICLAVFRAARLSETVDAHSSRLGASASLWWVASAGMLVAIAAALASWFLTPGRYPVGIPTVTPICMLLGFAIAHVLQRSSPEARARFAQPLAGVLQMCRGEFYTEQVLRRTIVLPVRRLSRFAEFLERRVIERGLFTVGQQLAGELDVLSSEIERESPRSAWQLMIAAVLVMLAAVWIAR